MKSSNPQLGSEGDYNEVEVQQYQSEEVPPLLGIDEQQIRLR